MSVLDPSQFFAKLNSINWTNDEIESRRYISALYFSLFNFWMEKANIQQGGDKDYPDMVKSLADYQTRTGNGIPSAHLTYLNSLRVRADHYHGNPIKIPSFNRNVYFDKNTQSDALGHANNILVFLKGVTKL